MSLERISRVTVANWRSWGEPFTVEDLGPGLTVLGGPNAAGKSGLWEAIVLGLLDRHWGSHTDRLRPAGTKRVIPRVEIEFAAAGELCRIEKHFGVKKDRARFLTRSNGDWVLRDEGEEAYRLCRAAVIGGTPELPGRGGLDKALRDTLLDVLLPAQGTLVTRAESLETVSVAVTDRTVADSATRLGRLLSRISAEADRFWVGRRDRPKTGTELEEGGRRLEEIDGEKKELSEKAGRIEEMVKSLAELRRDLDARGDSARRLDDASRFEEQAREHRRRREEAREAAETAAAAAEDRGRVWEARQRFLEERESAESALREAGRKLDRAEEAAERAERSREDAAAALEAARADLARYRAWREFETREERLAELTAQLAGVRDRMAAARKAREELDRLLREREGLSLPGDGEWAEWDELDAAVRVAEGRLSAAAWSVEGELPEGLELSVDGEPAAGLPATAAEEVALTGADGKVLRVRSGDRSAAEDLARARAAAAAFLDRYGAKDINELRRRNVHVKEGLNPAIERLRDGADGPEDLLREEVRLEQKIRGLTEGERPEVDRPDEEPGAWGVRLDFLAGEEKRLGERAEKATEERAARRAELAAERANAGRCEDGLKKVEVALAAHREEHGPDESVRAAAMDAGRTAAGKRSAWEEMEERRGAAEDALEKRAAGLKEDLRGVIEEQGRIRDLERDIDHLRREDPEGRLAALLAERAGLQARLREVRAEAEALKLIESALVEERERLKKAVGGPVRSRMEKWLRYLLQDESEVIVGEDGWPTAILSPSGREVPWEEQSFGTREQVGVLFRLAVAGLLTEGREGGACLMLDDPFGHTDRGRRERMLSILDAEAERAGHQVLVFTCRPEDFAGTGRHVSV